MARTEKKTLQILDIWLSSYFSLCGIPPKLELNNGRVVFTFPVTDTLYRLMTEYNSNVDVPVTDFVTIVKTLRGQMLTMRGRK